MNDALTVFGPLLVGFGFVVVLTLGAAWWDLRPPRPRRVTTRPPRPRR